MSPAESEMFYADGRTDLNKVIVAFLDFAKRPKIT